MSDEQKRSLTTTVSTAKISSVSGLEELLAVAEKQTINLIPKTITFGTRPELILTARLVFVNTALKTNSFTKNGKEIKYTEKSNGDIYLVDSKSKRYALSTRKLKEIADAGGVIMSEPERISVEHDANHRINSAHYRVSWERLDIDGNLKRGTNEGFYSYQAQIDKKKKDDDSEADLSYLEKQRGDGEKLAIANAYSRAIRDAIPQMQATFTLEELAKPLLIPSVTKDLSKLIEKYPDIEKALLAKELGLADLIYGRPQAESANISRNGVSGGQVADGSINKLETKPENKIEDVQIINEKSSYANSTQGEAGALEDGVPTKKEELQQQPKPEEKSPYIPKNGTSVDGSDNPPEAGKLEKPSVPTAEEKIKIAAKEFLDQPDDVRIKKIQELLKQKGRDWSGNKKVEQYSAKQQVGFIETLMKLPDIVKDGEKK